MRSTSVPTVVGVVNMTKWKLTIHHGPPIPPPVRRYTILWVNDFDPNELTVHNVCFPPQAGDRPARHDLISCWEINTDKMNDKIREWIDLEYLEPWAFHAFPFDWVLLTLLLLAYPYMRQLKSYKKFFSRGTIVRFEGSAKRMVKFDTYIEYNTLPADGIETSVRGILFDPQEVEILAVVLGASPSG